MSLDQLENQEGVKRARQDVEQLEVVFSELSTRETTQQKDAYSTLMEMRAENAHTVRSFVVDQSIFFSPHLSFLW